MVGSILGYMRTKVSFCMVLVGLGSPFYSEPVSILLAGVIHSIVQKRWGKTFFCCKHVEPRPTMGISWRIIYIQYNCFFDANPRCRV